MPAENTNLPVAIAHADKPVAGFVDRLTKTSLLGKTGQRAFGLSRLSGGGNASSTISIDFTIHGNISCNGQARLDGEVLGNVACKELIVGENGRIIGDINAETIVVYGSIQGSVYGKSVSLKSSAVVQGDIYHNGLGIELGASFLGKSASLE